VDSHGQGFYQAALHKGEVLWQLEDSFRRSDDVLTKRARPDRRSQHPLGGAQIDISGATEGTFTAGPLRVHSYSITDVNVSHHLTDGRDNARHFMSEDDWGLAIGMGTFVGVYFGTANAHSFDLDQNLVGRLKCGHFDVSED
jgi:hypothetical protein